jgi:hypothetical protein
MRSARTKEEGEDHKDEADHEQVQGRDAKWEGETEAALNKRNDKDGDGQEGEARGEVVSHWSNRSFNYPHQQRLLGPQVRFGARCRR